MPLAGDIIKVTLVQEIEGVQLSNTVYFAISDLGGDPTINDGLIDIMTFYYDQVKAALGNSWSLVCGLYENMTRVEAKGIAFSTLSGTGIGDTHPSDQVVRINQYVEGIVPAPDVRRGAFNQTGVLESLSTDGRVNDMAEFTLLARFLDTQQIMPGPNWTIFPQLRYQPTPSPPPQTHAFAPMVLGQVSSRMFKLGQRKTQLCKTG